MHPFAFEYGGILFSRSSRLQAGVEMQKIN